MYELDIDILIRRIKEKKHKRILIQLADGLKPKAKEIADRVEAETGAEVFIWMGSCYGGCDIPQGISPLKIDLVVQWGHSQFQRTEGW
jgi:diphthamide biosynthesis enzyme Dph1/Dph2-like protein